MKYQVRIDHVTVVILKSSIGMTKSLYVNLATVNKCFYYCSNITLEREHKQWWCHYEGPMPYTT